MITFIIALLVLVGGYFLYGSYVERVFGPDKIRKTPALTMADGVDFIPLPTWKIFMIQFLNIAGLGPIFGAIMGAKFGTASYLWIVLGTILTSPGFQKSFCPCFCLTIILSFYCFLSICNQIFYRSSCLWKHLYLIKNNKRVSLCQFCSKMCL